MVAEPHLAGSLPNQLADAFAALYDWLDPLFEEAYNHGWLDLADLHPAVGTLQRAVEGSDWETPWVLRDALAQAAASGDDASFVRAVYRCLYAIDRGFRLKLPSPATVVGRLLHRWDVVGRYNEHASGYVLPKLSTPSRSFLLADHLTFLVRANVDRDRVHVISRGGGVRYPQWRSNPKVAIVPFLYVLNEDATFVGVRKGSRYYFKVEHLVDGPANLEQRLRATVRALRQKEVNIAVFPELAFNERLFEVLRQELATQGPAGWRSSLDWVIVGAYSAAGVGQKFPVFNSAFVLDGSGRIIESGSAEGDTWQWVQHKRYPYKLTIEEQKDPYELVDLFRERRSRFEAIDIGSHVVVLEDRTGRYAVLICEDWSQEKNTCDVLRELGCTAVFVILMDGAVSQGRWAPQKAKGFTAQTGSFAVIANSLLLPNRPKCLNHRSLPKGVFPGGKQPVGLLYRPSGRIAATFTARATPAADDKSLVSSRKELPVRLG